VVSLVLNEQQVGALLCAMRDYQYPAELYDFKKQEKIVFRGMRELEAFLKSQLVSEDIKVLKFALANIVYWGNMNSGYCMTRVDRFLKGINEEKLEKAKDLFAEIKGNSLKDIKEIGLPQFSNISFVSKLRMFLDPTNYVTLDLKLLKIKESVIRTLFDDVAKYPTCIPINRQNSRQYVLWCQKCKETANTYFKNTEIIAVDVERGVWKLIDKGHLSQAADIVANM
jgi:hypothetical protein